MSWVGLCTLFHDLAISDKLKWNKTRETLLASSKWKTCPTGRKLKKLSLFSLAIVSMRSDLTVLSKHSIALKRDELSKQWNGLISLRVESLCAVAARLLVGCFAHTCATAVLFCVRETQSGNKSLFSALFEVILRRLTLLKFLLLIAIMELVQVFEKSVAVCHVGTPFGFVLCYHTTSAFSTSMLIERLITFLQSCSRPKLAIFFFQWANLVLG